MGAKSGESKKAKQNCWDEKFETMPIAELQKFQLRKLKETVAVGLRRGSRSTAGSSDEMGVAAEVTSRRSRISPSCRSP
ncbi:MAG: hypothetical protein MZV70_12205 [Desulfobacterales bacterium]|nr:hypothetical protein [Desulfobacterales bacterium]